MTEDPRATGPQRCGQCHAELDAAHLWSGICLESAAATIAAGPRRALRVVTAPGEVRLRLVLPPAA